MRVVIIGLALALSTGVQAQSQHYMDRVIQKERAQSWQGVPFRMEVNGGTNTSMSYPAERWLVPVHGDLYGRWSEFFHSGYARGGTGKKKSGAYKKS